jgi:magnesium chelatase family protein
MYTKTYSATLEGINAQIIGIEIDASEGVPGFTIVGLAGKSVNEARDRVSIALRSCEFDLEPKKILVNLSPAHLRKESTHFDLSIAAALMVNYGCIEAKPKLLEEFCFFGELSLTGEIKPTLGLLPLALEAQKHKIKYIIVSKRNEKEASLVSLATDFNSEIYAVSNLIEMQALVEAISSLREGVSSPELHLAKQCILDEYRVTSLDSTSVVQCHTKKESKLNLDDVIGQSIAKRGLEIAAAGGHHLLMIGPPGCGKSMLAHRFRGLLPVLSFDEALEVTKIYSICGLLDDQLILSPPLRAPHHSASNAALVGGGSSIKPGEVSLAHHGVLFLDELTEFNRHTIEMLRQILEEKAITINRIKQTLRFPADFIMIAACNPCPCGYLGDTIKACSCQSGQITSYLGKLSGPLLDRIDLHIELARLSQDEIKMLTRVHSSSNQAKGSKHQSSSTAILEKPVVETLTEKIKRNVLQARQFSLEESQGYTLGKEELEFMDHAVFNLELSARSHQKILRVSRTIADLAASTHIKLEHLAEAMQFRSVDWGRYRK